jgi:hypothetical protein
MPQGSCTAAPPAKAFRDAIDAAEHLQFEPGLGAIAAAEGADRSRASDARSLLGSAFIDRDCTKAEPHAHRWDYVVGHRRAGVAMAHFVEVHSAETSEVSAVERKLRWLLGFLGRSAQHALATLGREIHWVASGRVNIPKHTPQFRRLNTTLRKLGLRGPMTRLDLA